jgi:hypothetical protein
MFCHQNAKQNHNIKIRNETFQNVAKMKYFGKEKHKKIKFTRK